MKIQHPFGWISVKAQQWAFVILLLLTLILMLSLQVLDAPLKTEAAPLGIISFELAGELSLAQEMIASWGPQGQVYAGLSLGLDYLFLVAYAGAIALGCVLVGRSLSKRLPTMASLGVLLAWGQIGAALLDAVENYSLILILMGSEQEIWALIAKWSALPKFAIVIAGILYVFLGLLLFLTVKPPKATKASGA